jgi:hypothetical protein
MGCSLLSAWKIPVLCVRSIGFVQVASGVQESVRCLKKTMSTCSDEDDNVKQMVLKYAFCVDCNIPSIALFLMRVCFHV